MRLLLVLAGCGSQPLQLAEEPLAEGSKVKPSWQITGTATDEWLGWFATGVGDVDDDGYADFLLEDPHFKITSAGELFDGGPAPSTVPAWSYDPTPGTVSMSVTAAADDVDGDGLPEAVVMDYDCSRALNNQGCVDLFLGSPAGLAAAPDWTAVGALNQQLGYAASSGDLDGDGYADLAVSSASGRVDLYAGSSTGLGLSSAWDHLGGGYVYGYYGQAIAIGDLDGDGTADLVFSDLTKLVPSVSMFLGSPTGPGASADWKVSSAGSLNQFGGSLAIGDFDGDTIDDLAIGAWVDSYVDVYRGNVGGLGPVADWSFTGGATPIGFGHGLAANDANGDGFADLAVGAPFRHAPAKGQGSVVLLDGGPGGPSPVPTWALTGHAAGDNLGWGIDDAGDVNGDGLPDLLLTTPYATVAGASAAGEAMLVFGQ